MGTLHGIPFETVPFPLFKIKVLHTQICPNGSKWNISQPKTCFHLSFFLGPELCFSERHSNWAALAPDGNCGRTCNIGVMVGLGKPATFVFVSQKSSAFSASLVPCVRGNQIVQNLAPHTQISTFGLYMSHSFKS